MKLSLHKIEGILYSANQKVIPFVFKLEFDEEIIVDSNMHADTCLLINKEDEFVQVGGSSCITSIRGEEVMAGPNRPQYFLLNVLEDEEDQGVLKPGIYTLFGGVSGFAKSNGKFRPFEVKAEVEIEIQ